MSKPRRTQSKRLQDRQNASKPDVKAQRATTRPGSMNPHKSYPEIPTGRRSKTQVQADSQRATR